MGVSACTESRFATLLIEVKGKLEYRILFVLDALRNVSKSVAYDTCSTGMPGFVKICI
jgi:hypothetical protein